MRLCGYGVEMAGYVAGTECALKKCIFKEWSSAFVHYGPIRIVVVVDRRNGVRSVFHFHFALNLGGNMSCSWLFVIVAALCAYVVLADIDYALDCDPGYRVSAIKRTKTYYSVLGSLTVECEQISRPDYTTCAKQPSIPKCNGQLEGCRGDTWLAGFHAYLLENSTQAIVLDPVCCSSPHVRIDALSCINDQINTATKDFSHSLVFDLTYRGIQCWHQYSTNRTLVDLLWKTEICPFESADFPVVTTEQFCDECNCACGVEQCASGVEPVRIIHKKRLGKCGCDCRCSYQCIKFE